MEHLSPLDAMFLDAEEADPHGAMAIGSVAVADGPAPAPGEVEHAIGSRLGLVRRYRQKVLRTPWNLGRPVWVDDPHFDIRYHVRSTALPAPGDEAALRELVAWIMSQRLDRDRPLWQYWAIEGLPGGRWALLSKVHHCLVDGVGGNQLYRLLFDATATPSPFDDAGQDAWQPEPEPTGIELALDAMGDLVRAPLDALAQLSRGLAAPSAFNQYLLDTTRGLAALAGSLLPVPPSSLTGPIGASRRYGVARVAFPKVSAVAKAFEVTVNDVVVAAVTGAFRLLLLHRGEQPHGDYLRAMVPVSVRAATSRSTIDNRVSMMLPTLPVEIADPVERLRKVHARLATLKASKEAEAGDAMYTLAQYEPFSLFSAGVRMAARLPQRSIATVATNVPGPRHQLYFRGRPIVELLPYVPIAGQMRFGISVLTYGGQAVFGVTGDYETAPEVDLFAGYIADGIADLAAAVPVTTQPAPAIPKPRKARRANAVPTLAGPMQAVPAKAVPVRAVPAKAVPMQAVPAKAVPVRAVPRPRQSIRTAKAQPPAKTPLMDAQPVSAQPTKSRRANASPAQAPARKARQSPL